jgi:uncharacterized protein YbbC (DUF1343 family)
MLLALAACAAPQDRPAAEAPPALRTGAEVLAESGFERLRGLRVGLIANHTTRVGDRHLSDLLAEARDVELAALFGPEHGIRGDTDDGVGVGDTLDAATGVPVYSLYGQRRSPPPGVLDSLDVLVFDIQDVGARFYTFISTMGHSMQAAAAAGVPFVVLDRPNPLGGDQVDGFVLEPGHESFVGLYPIPVQHGMTVGELALMIRGEGWLPGLDSLDLDIVRMEGWARDRLWPDLGREWIPTSPNIPSFEAALVYPGTCFIEGTTASEGRGTETPFLLIGAPWLDAARAASLLADAGLPGVEFHPTRFTPVSIPGKDTHPKHENVEIAGIHIGVTDPRAVRPLAVGIHLLSAFATDPGAPDDFIRATGLARLSGSERLASFLAAGTDPDSVIASWSDEVAAFELARRPYLLYE